MMRRVTLGLGCSLRHFLQALIWVSLLIAIGAAEPIRLPSGFPNTQEAGQNPPTPQEALAGMSVPDGFTVTLFAGEPDISQPIAMTVDDRGRLWVAQCFTSPTWVDTPTGPDRILIFSDTDQDGQFDEKKVFADNLANLTGLEVGMGGVWACCAPNLVFIPDADGDDQPDGPAKVILDGWALPDHNLLNGLTWGPDGWLYGAHGILGTSRVGIPGTPDPQRIPINCGIWRYHPTQRRFEVVGHGTTNPWGLDFDERGHGFFTNCVIGHLWHLVHGAHYKRMSGTDFNPHVYDLIDSCADHRHWDGGDWKSSRFGVQHDQSGGGHAHSGAMIYLGDNWPEQYRGSLLTCNIHGNRVNRDRLEKKGSGFIGRHCPDFLRAEDHWFVGLELVYGPDGGVYISDWSDFGECHDNDGVHRTSGRIYKIVHGHPQSVESTFDVSQLSDAALIELQTHRNDWFARRARLNLQHRIRLNPSAVLKAVSILPHEVRDGRQSLVHRLRYLWTLHVTSGVETNLLLELLEDTEPDMRVWAVRLLADRGSVPASAHDALIARASLETSPFCRLHLASLMNRLPLHRRLELAEALVANHDPVDHNLSLMTWYGLEPAVPHSVDASIRLAENCRDSLIRQFIIKRLVAEKSLAKLDPIVETMSARRSHAQTIDVLQGLDGGLQLRDEMPSSGSWSSVARQLYGHHDTQTSELALRIGLKLSDPLARGRLKQLALDAAADSDSRREAIEALAADNASGLTELLFGLLDDSAVRVAVIRGLARLRTTRVADVIIDRYADLSSNERREAITTLTARPEWSIRLLESIDAGNMPATDVATHQIRQLALLKRSEIDDLMAQIWPVNRKTSEEKQEQIKKYKAILGEDFLELGDPSAGRALYHQACAKCHKLFDDGGDLGPELTGSGRKNIDYILQNVVDPSATTSKAFRVSVVETNDGNVLSGVVVERSSSVIELRNPETSRLIKRSDIYEISPLDQSLMPDGLLDTFNEQQLRDLVAYLFSDQQVALPAH